MNNDELGPSGCLGVALIFCLVISGMAYPAIYYSDMTEIKKRAIQKDHAYYDKKTGEFTWSDNVSAYIFGAENIDGKD